MNSKLDETIMMTTHDHPTPLELLPHFQGCDVAVSLRPSLNNLVVLPELAEIIACYLSRSDYVSLVLCSRAWRTIWTPYLYSYLDYPQFQDDDPDNAYYRALVLNGHLVRTLEVTRSSYTLPLIQLLPNLTTLTLDCARLNEQQLGAILGLVPKLKILRCLIMTHSHLSIALVATLKYLEKLEWHYYTATDAGMKGEVELDELLQVLRSCPRLSSLSLAHVLLLDAAESHNGAAYVSDHDQARDWTNSALWRLSWTSVYLFMPSSHRIHPLVQKLFKYMPSLISFQVQGRSNLTPLDWIYIFREKSDIRHLHLSSLVATDTFVQEALEAAAPTQTKLQSLELGRGSFGTNAAMKDIIQKNHGLQRLKARGSDLGDKALVGLIYSTTTRLPLESRCLSAGVSMLRHLDLQNCMAVTSYGATIVLETCPALLSLDLRGTLAGKWDLFQGDRPWACAHALKEFYLDIQPRSCMTPMGHEWDREQGSVDPEPYSPEEEEHIKKRIHGFTALKVLFLRGHAMSFSLVDKIATISSLQRVDLRIPELPATRHWSVDWTMEMASGSQDYQWTRLQAVTGMARALFPQWRYEATWRCPSPHRYYYSIHASREI